jgi:ABC-type multidrug transport system fused ATPase/permease subunit
VALIVMILKRYSSLMENVLGGTIVDSFQKNDWSEFVYQTSLLTGSYIAYSVLATVESFLLQRVTTTIGRTIKLQLFTSLMVEKPQAFFDESKSGDLTSRLSTDCDSVADRLGGWIPIFVTEVFEVGFGVVFMLTTHFRLSAAIALLLPVMALATWIQTKWEDPLQEAHTKLVGEVNAQAVETIMQVKTVKIFGKQKREIARFAKQLSQLDHLNWRLSIASGFSLGLLTVGYHVCMVATFWYGGSLVLAGELSSGQFLAFCLFAMSLSDSVNYLPELNSRMISILASAERVYSIIEETKNADPNTGIVPPATHIVKGHIKFEGVRFAYPSRIDSNVLQDFNLEILPGQSAALVGSSGGGKSTIVSLLTRLYEPTGGIITIDGLDVMKLQPNWLRKQIGLVSQEPVLFSGTIRENICYGLIEDEEVTEESFKAIEIPQERLEEVARMANAHDFVSALPDGYDTMVGERGSMLSAGQRQRISIARALLRDPKILITDEATSALDNSSERVVQQALERLMQNRTCIVIAHRLSTIRQCYPICFMGKGKVLETGSHEELMSLPGGHYAQLHTYELEREHLKASFGVLAQREVDEDGTLHYDPEPTSLPTSVVDQNHSAIESTRDPLTTEHSPRSRGRNVI